MKFSCLASLAQHNLPRLQSKNGPFGPRKTGAKAMSQLISVTDAYKAMYYFLDKTYRLTKSDDLGSLLGWMSTLDDGTTADPAVWSDWLEAIEAATRRSLDTTLTLEKKE